VHAGNHDREDKGLLSTFSSHFRREMTIR